LAADLRDRILERAIETAVDEEAIKKEAFRPRREPKDKDQQANQEKELQKTDRHPRQRCAPGERDAEGIKRADAKKNERGDAQDGGHDRDQIDAELETAEGTPNDSALEESGGDDPGRQQAEEGRHSEHRDVMPGEVEERRAQPEEIHGSVSVASCQARNKKHGRSRVLG
jgi:hypothetical protein